jgi:hypothetical protein
MDVLQTGHGITWLLVSDCQSFLGLHECGGETVKRIVLTPETSAVPGQSTASVQWDPLAVIVRFTLSNSVEGKTCDCRLPPRSR